MQRLSSSLTVWWYKRLGPVLLAVAAVVTAAILAALVWRGQISAAWLLLPLVLSAIAFAYVRYFVWPLADEVFDDGDSLVIRRQGKEWRLHLRDVARVDYSLVFDPPRMILRTSSATGREKLIFMPYLNAGMCFFRPHPLLAELRARVGKSSGQP